MEGRRPMEQSLINDVEIIAKDDMKDIVSGYAERMRRLFLFEPLAELERKKEADINGHAIDMKGLGLLTLLYFFEQKLIRNQRTGVRDVAHYLQLITYGRHSLSLERYDQLARTIITTFRPATGKKKTYSFYNWETNVDEVLAFSFIKDNQFDSKTNTQFYTLDEDGLELVFATKEFYSEFQLSINQLILRKQLEKGEFKGALRQINEMHIDVETLQERMIKISHEIKRNIISEETYERYKGLLEDISFRLQRENEEFGELHEFIKETKERIYDKDTTKKEQKAYVLVLKISKGLEQVHGKHTQLLEESIVLQNTALKAAQESLYYVGIDSFNFDQDILARMVSSPLPLEAMEGVLAPFLKPYYHKQWSPITLFASQTIAEEQDVNKEQTFLQIGDDNQHMWFQEIQRKNFGRIMEELIVALNEQDTNTITLEEFIAHIHKQAKEVILKGRSFYDFWILLHQRSPLMNQDQENKENSAVAAEHDRDKSQILDDVLYRLDGKVLMVEELPQLLNVTSRYTIQNMRITMGDVSYVI